MERGFWREKSTVGVLEIDSLKQTTYYTLQNDSADA